MNPLRTRTLALSLLLAACTETNSASNGDDGSTGGETDGTDSTGAPTTTMPSVTTTAGPTTAGTDMTSAADETTEDGATEDGATETTGDVPETCDDEGEACVAPIPEGWSGPAAVITSSTAEPAPNCAGGYELAMVLGATVLADAAECTCECGPVTGASCDDFAVLEYYLEEECDFGEPPAQTFGLIAGVAVPVTNFIAQGDLVLDPVEAEGGSCDPSATETISPADFTTRVTLCETSAVTGGCEGDELCAPTPIEPLAPEVCVWQAGEHACPEAYPVQSTYFASIADDRSCTNCACAAPSLDCADAQATITGSGGPGSYVVPATGLCDTVGAMGMTDEFAVFDPGEPSGACNAIGGIPTGTAVGSEPITVCCAM
jgi:hypothetical protein